MWIWIMKAKKDSLTFEDENFDGIMFSKGWHSWADSQHVNKANWKLNIFRMGCRWSLNVYQIHRSDTEKNNRKFRLFYCVYKSSWALYHLFWSYCFVLVHSESLMSFQKQRYFPWIKLASNALSISPQKNSFRDRPHPLWTKLFLSQFQFSQGKNDLMVIIFVCSTSITFEYVNFISASLSTRWWIIKKTF